jgi:hypothetical protein
MRVHYHQKNAKNHTHLAYWRAIKTIVDHSFGTNGVYQTGENLVDDAKATIFSSFKVSLSIIEWLKLFYLPALRLI